MNWKTEQNKKFKFFDFVQISISTDLINCIEQQKSNMNFISKIKSYNKRAEFINSKKTKVCNTKNESFKFQMHVHNIKCVIK